MHVEPFGKALPLPGGDYRLHPSAADLQTEVEPLKTWMAGETARRISTV